VSANFLLANNPCSIDATVGAAAGVGSGGYTVAMLVRPTIGNNDMAMFNGRVAGVTTRAMFESGLHLFGVNDFSTGDATTLAQGNWYVTAQTKLTGPNMYNHHLWLYDPSGAGIMAHGVSTGSANQGDGAALDLLRIGNGPVGSNGDIAVLALWDSVLSNAQLNTLRSASLAAWAALAPKELVTYQNWNGATGWSTRIGSSAQSALNGTVGVGANPPSFDFALGANVDLTPASFTFSAVPVDAQPISNVTLTPASFTFSAPPVTPFVPGAGGVDVDWCADLAPNWVADVDENWTAMLGANWSAQLVEECA
jgi:hypothetical protein